MAIGDIRPVEGNCEANRVDDDPMFPHLARGAGDQHPEANEGQYEEEPLNKENVDPKGNADPEGDANPEGNANPEGQADPEEEAEPQANEAALYRV